MEYNHIWDKLLSNGGSVRPGPPLNMPGRVFIISGESITTRACSPKAVFDWSGCKSTSFAGASADVCICDTDLCNAAVMTSSLGHVIIVVALVVTGYLM